MYSAVGRPSIPPERLLKASLLMALHTVRSERMFCEQLDYNLLFRWFLDLDVDEASFDHSTFSRNRARLLEHEVAREFFTRVVAQARGLQSALGRALHGGWHAGRGVGLAQELQAQGAGPSQPPEDPGNPTVNFHGERRSNATHQSTTDPEAKLAQEGRRARKRGCVTRPTR